MEHRNCINPVSRMNAFLGAVLFGLGFILLLPSVYFFHGLYGKAGGLAAVIGFFLIMMIALLVTLGGRRDPDKYSDEASL